MNKNKLRLKKILETIDTLESSTDQVVYALDETSIRVESNNYNLWSEVGNPPILEKNGSHEGINIVGSTCIFNTYHCVNDVYPSNRSIKSKEIQSHLEYLLELTPDKKVIVFLDNARNHTSKEIKDFYKANTERLQLIFLPRYSPYMNPQETIWRYLKSKIFRASSRSSIDELISDVKDIFDELNENPHLIRSLAYGRSFLV